MDAHRLNANLTKLELRLDFAIKEAKLKGVDITLDQELFTFDSLVKQALRRRTPEAVNTALNYEHFLFNLINTPHQPYVPVSRKPSPWWVRVIRSVGWMRDKDYR